MKNMFDIFKNLYNKESSYNENDLFSQNDIFIEDAFVNNKLLASTQVGPGEDNSKV